MINYHRGRSVHPRTLLSLTLGLLGGLFCLATISSAQGPGTKDGQWSFLGGDAWHTRYTTADQINAENFGNLKLAWRFNAGSFGPEHSPGDAELRGRQAHHGYRRAPARDRPRPGNR